MSLIKIRIASSETVTKSGTSKTGKPYSFKQQTGFVDLNDEIRKIDITLDDGVSAYQVGNYTLDLMQYIVVGRFGFEFDRFKPFRLVPASVSAIPKVA